MGFWTNLFGGGEKKSCCGGSCSSQNVWEDAGMSADDMETIKTIDPNIVVGKSISVEQHPDPKMTKVRVAQVSFGDVPVQILCGGVNLMPGQLLAVARVGAKLSEDFEIGVRDIRGVTSNGMICARSELNLSSSTEQKGEIWVLPPSFETFVGKPLNSL